MKTNFIIAFTLCRLVRFGPTAGSLMECVHSGKTANMNYKDLTRATDLKRQSTKDKRGYIMGGGKRK